MTKTYKTTKLGDRLLKLAIARESDFPDLRECELRLKWARDDRLDQIDKDSGI